MKAAVSEFLLLHGFLPLEQGSRWGHCVVRHPAPADLATRQQEREDFLRNVPTGGGLYAYRDATGAVLYLGQSNTLRARLRHHYREMCEPLSATGSAAFHAFFNGKPGPLRVYWTAMDDHASRRVIEVAMQFVTEEEWNRGRARKFA